MRNRISERFVAHRPSLVATLIALGVSSACVSIELPERFLAVYEDPGELRAITPDEAKVWVRTFDETGGDLAFWVEALKLDLIERRGYVLIEERAVADGAGLAGHEMLCETTLQSTPTRYLVAVFVEPRTFGGARIRVLEYIAERKVFDRYLDEVRASVASLR